ncbi:DeoR/GlpR family DNA-binding transcription regulator [Nakamurella endophytica]|uniref:DeoR family transcriptional regulator n=1 Tax=Nakamurella endophytica TaxID=1748367 RepID=A0A917WN83_9ACTN|nr:DeoR/GlpR family DNA-binding transcription regulator [Nakamurella endophytica]GGM16635.1 DeoR family transcriptional regulator [Nakamurella endophytica]
MRDATDAGVQDVALPRRRRALLTEFVSARGQATVTELAEQFHVSTDTVRRDLDWLATEGLLARTYGGAVVLSGLTTSDTGFSDRAELNQDAKRMIAQAAVDLIGDGETVLLNGGTTTLAVARAIGGRRDLTVVTNNIKVPAELPAAAVRDVYLLGGTCRMESSVTIGPVGFPGMAGISADVAVIGVGGVSARTGLSTTNLPEAQMMAQMLESAHRTVVVADATKFNRNAFAHIASLEAVDTLVTDAAPPEELTAALVSADIDLVVVPAAGRRER